MKKSSPLLFLLILFWQSTFGQEESLDYSKLTIVENEKANFVYRGMDNTIRIHMIGMDSLTANHESVKKVLDGDKFIIRPGKEDLIKLKIKGYKNDNIITVDKEFRVIDVIRPYGSVNGEFKSLTIEKSKLLEAHVECVLPNILYYPEYQFAVYKFSFELNGGETFENLGDTFEEKFEKMILDLSQGDQIYIFDIRAIHKGSSSIKLKRPEPIQIFIE